MSTFDDTFEEVEAPTAAQVPRAAPSASTFRQTGVPAPRPGASSTGYSSWVNADSRGNAVPISQRLPPVSQGYTSSRTSSVHQSLAMPGHPTMHRAAENPAKRMKVERQDSAGQLRTQQTGQRFAFASQAALGMSATSPGLSRGPMTPPLLSPSRDGASQLFAGAYSSGSYANGGSSRGIPVISGHSAKQSQMQPREPVIDLVSSDDDEVQFTGSKNTGMSKQKMEEYDLVVDDSPICIGQISSSYALIMYPVPIVSGRTENTPDGPRNLPPPNGPIGVTIVRASALGANETLKISVTGEGENFAVVEHRTANVLGPFMGPQNKPPGPNTVLTIKSAVIRKGEFNPMMLPLTLLLFCKPSYVQIVADALEKARIFLEHPASYDPAHHRGARYSNPHDTSEIRANEAQRQRNQLLGSVSGQNYAYSHKTPQQRAVEAQREQVEQVFASLRSGVDMPEKEPPAIMVKTQLYKHQKQALSFLLHREEVRQPKKPVAKSKAAAAEADDEDDMISLWKMQTDNYGRVLAWKNMVTSISAHSPLPPPQCRGAILADDMGLGKTIVMISLIASTLEDAHTFASFQPIRERDTDSHFDAVLLHPSSASNKPAASSFATQPWGMGMGQTPAQKKKKEESKTQKKREEHDAASRARLVTRSRATLIICPLSTIQNWESQIEEHTSAKASVKGKEKSKSALSVYVYHGPSRTNDPLALADHDVVLTTFSTLASEYSKLAKVENKAADEKKQAEERGEFSDLEEVDAAGEPVKPKVNGHLSGAIESTGTNTPAGSADEAKPRKRKRAVKANAAPLQMVEWFRIVLDEAHMIKEHSTIQAKAACELAAERRTCLTGTPLQNQLDDLFSLIRFLRLEPFTDRAIWNSYIGSQAKLGDPLAVSRLQLVMRHLALRRTKLSKDSEGKPILDLPRRSDELIHLQLNESEKAYYSSHHIRYKHNFELAMQQPDTLMKNYCSILQELLRLRQICDHPDLVRESEDANRAEGDVIEAIRRHGISSSRAAQLFALLRDNGSAQCVECGYDLAPAEEGDVREELETEDKPAGKKRKGGKAAANGEEAAVGPSSSSNVKRILTRCTHLYCLGCFRKAVCPGFPNSVTAADRATCSTCNEDMSPVLDAVEVQLADLEKLSLADATDGTADKKKEKTSAAKVHSEPSTKIHALLSDILPFSQANPASENYVHSEEAFAYVEEKDDAFRPHRGSAVKSVVFSQWVKLLDKIGYSLTNVNIKYARLDGTMSRTDRSKAMDAFKEDPACEVLLVSLRAGGVGLNLTAAQRVYLMEPFWNPAVEMQALDRVHRLGQTRPVKTKRFVMQETIESNMLLIQKRKTDLANLSMSATLSKAELAKQRVEDLKTLLS